MFRDEHWNAHMSEPINFIDPDKRRRIDALDEIKRALEVAEILPFRFWCSTSECRMNISTSTSRPCHDRHRASARFRQAARSDGVGGEHSNELSTPEKLIELLQTAHSRMLCLLRHRARSHDEPVTGIDVLEGPHPSTHVHDNTAQDDRICGRERNHRIGARPCRCFIPRHKVPRC